jgi:hypothetical protein
LFADHLQNLYREIVGKSLAQQTAQEYIDILSSSSSGAGGGLGGSRAISYEQAEMIVLRELMETGVLPSLSDGYASSYHPSPLEDL